MSHLRACLEATGWTQAALARHIGWSDGMIRWWLRGNGSVPPALDAWLAKVAALYSGQRPETIEAFHRDNPPPETVKYGRRPRTSDQLERMATIEVLRATGLSWQEIGDREGLTKQAINQFWHYQRK